MDWDRPGVLSIVVQGALFQGNLVETANHCRHWRELFPAAEIVLVLSVTDVTVGRLDNGIFTSLRLAPKHRHDGHLQAALDVILESCDKIGLSRSALPLPPIKTDSPKLNNMNFQIAAAQHGLSLVSGLFVLRIRSDMIFMNRSFLDQYREAETLPRGEAAVFAKRVMISWLYTLNPFSIERMPLHHSDWFHFGLTEDVRRIWAVPPITLSDSIFYKTNPHHPGSNQAERVFNIRLAVEQHLMYNCFKDEFPELTLDYHNDRSSVKLALDILIDNFAVCDVGRAHCVFDKYGGEFHDPAKRHHCITAEGWQAMARARDADYETTLSRTLAAETVVARDFHKAESRVVVLHDRSASDNATSVPHREEEFPRRYDASRLRTRAGLLVDGTITGTSDGTLFYGPYVGISAGRYVATVDTTVLQGPGVVTLRVTLDTGNTVLAQKKFGVGSGIAPELKIAFDVVNPEASDLEIVCSIKGIRRIAVTGVTISRRADLRSSGSKWLALRSALQGRKG